MRPYLEVLRLSHFKTFHDEDLRLRPMTVLIGRNSSGKSNALDGLEVLSRLATGADLVDALDSRRGDEGPLRGGLESCPPHGSDHFTLGCEIVSPEGSPAGGYRIIELDLTIKVRPEPEIVYESLRGYSGEPRAKDAEGRASQSILVTHEPIPGMGSIDATMFRGLKRRSARGSFRSTRLLTAQLPLRMAGENEAELGVVRAAETVLEVLRGVFHLDPVPHLMRQYVPGRDIKLRRTAENLSAVIGQMARRDPERFRQLLGLVQKLVEHQVTGLDIIRSELNDVMLALDEGDAKTSAREMSDGLLRFVAIATALLGKGSDLDVGGRETGDAEHPVTVVIEELENGLHPSQARKLLELVEDYCDDDGARALFTTHSPALLSALGPRDHDGVVVCSRDPESGRSRLRRLPEIDGYPSLMAQGQLGEIVTSGLLEETMEPGRDFSEFDRLMGLE
ncbi:AAA family ATPase [Sphaerisporangium corydalis]|uniref:AAA family ATPase n=1 Tax=Sphaerisporangium corydalis TaxID=1441875 RepID=A0ABV9EPR7_9ACTN|nr:ATP-binding protein [Sphaerisporangium corydalis]